ncbi:MAG: hypothetical protein QMD99_26085, partial [Rhizobiaceae bacterium]|nr:hypothetical protein [Rhizobiaceae bacterium]
NFHLLLVFSAKGRPGRYAFQRLTGSVDRGNELSWADRPDASTLDDGHGRFWPGNGDFRFRRGKDGTQAGACAHQGRTPGEDHDTACNHRRTTHA